MEDANKVVVVVVATVRSGNWPGIQEPTPRGEERCESPSDALQ